MQKAKIKPFAVYGFDTLTIGSTYFKNGAYIGVPINYFYETKDDIDKETIQIRHQKIDWNSEQGKLLQEALVLSDHEKIFAIMKAILETDNPKIIFDSIFPVATVLFIYTLASRINASLKLLARPFMIRGTLYSILSVFGMGIYAFSKDFTQVYYETEVDKKLVEMGPEFMQNGIKFYTKLLQKNIAIRELTNDEQYSAKGNVNVFLRQTSLPLTFRKKFFEEKLKEYLESNEEKS